MDKSLACAAFINYKRHDLAQAMVEQLRVGLFPVYAVDNGGGLGSLAWAAVIRFDDNRLFTANWNRAMERLTGSYEFVWMLNDDVLGVSQEMLTLLVAVMQQTGAAAITPAFNSPHKVFHRDGYVLRQVPWMDWTCPLVRTEAWLDIGPFDERFIGYGADIDWCKRARDGGWSFYVHDGLEVRHLGSQTAISQGLQSKQGNVSAMNRLLCEKWGVKNWAELTANGESEQ